MSLRQNQIAALEVSNANDFASGIHFHATGTGKSWIALQLLQNFFNRYPKSNVMWICEQKSILIDQFNKQVLVKKGFHHVVKNYHILDYSVNKASDWTNTVNCSRFWTTPALVIINRAFLTSGEAYERLKLKFDLIIHDECHSISNSTTQAFYTWIMKKFPEIKCIGFSATPTLTISPYTKLLSKYSIYNSVCDEVIVPPRIVWLKSTDELTDQQYAVCVYHYLSEMVYQKCVIWCGMIDYCIELAKLYQKIFPTEFLVAIDTSDEKSNSFASYEEFYKAKSHALLFCAAKHREGSDIPFLDSCVFLDRVESRSPKVFTQCIGRVLRFDPEKKKKMGLIMDIKAKSSINICNRMNQYINNGENSSNVFPWRYQYDKVKFDYENQSFTVHENNLFLVPQNEADAKYNTDTTSSQYECRFENVQTKFIRVCPASENYQSRLKTEWEIFSGKNLVGHLLQAVEILELTNYIPHVTRGSCGSSLICYLLGISNVDPVVYNISFARFLNSTRSTLPDIDFDFPHLLRDEVFLKLQIRWPNQIARISNHNYYHEKSAHREALKRIGIKGFIPKESVHQIIDGLDEEKKVQFDEIVEELDNTFRHYSLHCGGIVFYPEGIPQNLILNPDKCTKVLKQIKHNKQAISDEQRFKVDILSSRGITQLYEAMNFPNTIDWEAHRGDEKTTRLLHSGDNIGLTLAESSLIRKAMIKFKPSSPEDLGVILAIIRPAARTARSTESFSEAEDEFVFDDDAITMISEILNCPEDEADQYRRSFAKGSQAEKTELKKRLKDMNIDNSEVVVLLKKLGNLRRYSFCKSHAYSYGQLVWQLAYMKANFPQEFWKSSLKHCHSSYRRWVHLGEAWMSGVKVDVFNARTKSIYSQSRRKKLAEMSALDQLRSYGCWDIEKYGFIKGCGFELVTESSDQVRVKFRGIFASFKRMSKRRLVGTIGIDFKSYVEVVCLGREKWMSPKTVGVFGEGVLKSTEPPIIETEDFTFF